MAETTFTFRVDEDLKAAFAETAKAQERTSAQLLRVLMRETVDRAREKREYDEWFLQEVDAALAEADDPNTEWVSHEDVRADWQKQRAELIRRLEEEKRKRPAAE